MTPQELKQHRIQLFRDCAAWRKPERVPFLANIVTWKIIDSGYKFSEALHDYDIMSKCVTNFLDKYNVDVLTDTGVRNPMRIPESIGESYYYVNDEAEALGVHAYSLCEKQELAELAQDTDKFVWEKMFPRKFPNFQHLKKEDFQRALDEQLAFNNYTAGITKVVREQYGLPALTSLKCGFPNAGVEEMFSMVRGIRGLSLDMRRNPDDLLACIHAYEKKTLDPVIEKVYASEDGPDPDACFDLGIMLLAHTVMSESQWEKFYWPSLKRLLDAAAAKKKSVRLTVEGSLSRFFRYFADYPKGVVTLNLDQDDVVEARQALPNCCIAGGLTAAMLGRGTPQDCIDRLEYLYDAMDAKNGGFILTTDKFISYRNDAKPENLKAVCDFVTSYRF